MLGFMGRLGSGSWSGVEGIRVGSKGVELGSDWFKSGGLGRGGQRSWG